MPGWVVALELVVIIGLLFGIYRTLKDVADGLECPPFSKIVSFDLSFPPERSTDHEEKEEEL